MDTSTLLSCRGLVPEFPEFDFDGEGLDLDVHPGEIVCFIGPDYTGKSEWLSALGGVTARAAGTLELAGQDSDTLDSDDWSRVRRKLAYVRNDTAVLSAATARQNVLLPARYHRMDPAHCTIEAAAELLDELGVTDHLSLPAYLRPDQRYRIAIARALLLRPAAMLLDTPFSNLDALASEMFQATLLERVQQDALAIVIVTHDIDFAVRHAGQIVFVTHERIHRFDGGDAIRRCEISYIENFLRKNRIP